MLKGIDVSNWQAGLVPSKIRKIDFCISKATESVDFVDKYCDGFIQDCIKHDILFGYYHFAGVGNNPIDEAKFFWNATLGYTGHGIPILDYEVWKSQNDISWCETFIKTYRDISGIWPILYISASHCPDFKKSWIPGKCGLWVAGYNRDYINWPEHDDMPYDVSPWKFAAIWQFADDFKLTGYNNDLDADIAFMDDKAWLKYAGSKTISDKPKEKQPAKSCEELANEVIAGKWGNGWNRKNALDSAYGAGTYDHVQMIVNNLLGLDGC